MSDLIERKKAIEAMGKAQWAKERLMELPSAQPDTKAQLSREDTTSDCISRQDAIDAVGNMLRRKFGIGGDLAEITLACLPSATPKQRMGEWTPVSERLPKNYGNYLVTYRTDPWEADIGTFDPSKANSDNGAWSACDADGFYFVASKGLEVCAWMPLPEPYRSERRTDKCD